MVIGVDIGGANLKGAHSSGVARSVPFALWQEPKRLPQKLSELIESLPSANILAVTMTGELCDCFAGKEDGVRQILAAVRAVAGSRRVDVWTNRGCFVDLAQAEREPLSVAAANWLAVAFAATKLLGNESGLLIDIGSTTTDIIPIVSGRPVPRALADPDRLRTKELLYCGVRRTPLCALLGIEGTAAEWFATTLDVFLILGILPEDPTDVGTADHRPATRAAAHSRLAHMLCGDAATCSPETTLALAERALQIQLRHLADGVRTVSQAMPVPPRKVVISGSGEFLARRLLESGQFPKVQITSLRQQWGAALSEAACAFALTQISGSLPGELRPLRPPLVVKVGGSLYDLPDLAGRLGSWLAALQTNDVILVPGGGPLAEGIREYDRIHGLGEETSHWLALQTMTINARFLARLLPGTEIVGDPQQRTPGRMCVLDGYAFAQIDESRLGRLPHSWRTTSDSLALRAAVVAGAREVVLLKSVELPTEATWEDAVRLGIVDPLFARVLPAGIEVRIVDLRGGRAPLARRG